MREAADRLNKSYLDGVCCQDKNGRPVYDFRAAVSRPISVDQQEPDLERRISEIQAQLDRLSAVVEHPAESRGHVALMESQLSLLTQQCAEILNRWSLTDLRHTRAIGEMEGRLTDWERLESRVEQDAHERLRELERKIEQEWLALRHMLEEPVRQLQEHSASLRETSVATAGSALAGLERAETRLATIQADVSDRMGQLSRDVQAVVAELRGGGPHSGQPVPGVPSWPLDQVMRLHNEFRETEGGDLHPPDDRPPKTITLLPESAASLSQRIESVEQAIATGKEIVRVSHKDAERQIAKRRKPRSERRSSARFLRHPNLVRYGLSRGETAPTARGQVLWSRSRGLVFSGSNVPQVPPDSTYQLWLLTNGGAVSVAEAKPDSEGRISVAIDAPPSVPRPVVGVALTLEPRGGRSTPSGVTVLAHQPAVTDPPPSSENPR
jgi:hypothetical protein